MNTKFEDSKLLIDGLIKDLKITARCRFNAARRLKFKNRVSYVTNVIVSLGLILIPLLQVSGIQNNFAPLSLASMQIFLAVSVLVYSIHISSSRFELRIKELEDCGNEIQRLIRELKHEKIDGNADLKKYWNNYAEILNKVENHEDSDFNLTRIQMKQELKISDCELFRLEIKSVKEKWKELFFPLTLLMFELIFILDMLGITKFLTPLHQLSREI